MKKEIINVSRRDFLISSGKVGAGFSHGLYITACSDESENVSKLSNGLTESSVVNKQTAQTPEVNAWVVIQPDDTVIIRIARSEMGQGTLTGLAQMVAEELECDWSKVTTEYPTPGENIKRDNVWRDFATGGSFGIRGSHFMCAKAVLLHDRC